MRKRIRGISWATLVLSIGAIAAAGFSHAENLALSAGQPDAVPPTGLPDNAPPFGLPDSAPPFGRGIGKGMGKGKGHAVAGVSYHCLGVAKQTLNQGSPYSYLADSIVLDAGQGVTLNGTATGDLVVDNETTVPTHMAGASISTDGLMLQPFDTCGTSAGSALNSVVVGVDQTNSSAVGAAYVEFRFNYHAKLEFQNTGSEGDFSAFTEATLHVLGYQEESFKVSADGKLTEAPPGLTVTDLSVGDHFLYEVAGTHVVEGQLYYGSDVTNIVQTTFQASGEVTGLNIKGSKIVAGFASAEALNTLTYEIVSLDPNISFSFVPAQATEEETTGAVSP